MKILKLELKNFGPYREHTEIDFEQFDNKMFLICGETGAGKTIIFDAISYALYGQPSGEYRTDKMLRSKSAPLTEEAYVKLDFVIKGKKYRVERIFEQQVAKKRGEGLTTKPELIRLYLPDGSCIDEDNKKTEIKEKLNDLLKLSHKQFTMTMMLAQGESVKLLNSNTNDRQPLFSELFGTKKYDTLSSELDKMNKAADQATEAVRERIKEIYLSIACGENDGHYSRFEELKALGSNAHAQMKELVSELIDADSKASQQKEKELAELEKQLSAAKLALDNIEKRRKLTEQLNNEQAAYKAHTEALENERAKLSDASARLPEAQRLETEAAQLETQLDVYAKLDDTKARAQQQKKALSDANADKAQTEALKQTAAKALAEMKAEYSSLADAGAKLEQAKAAASKVQSERESMTKLSGRLTALLDLKSSRAAKSKQLDGLKAKADKLDSEIKSTEQETADFEERIKAYADLPRQLQQIKNDIENTRKSSADFSRLLDDKTHIDILAAMHKTAAEEFGADEKKETAARERYERLESIFRRDRAGILAAGLVDNEPCPVCGSTHHPNPARLDLEEGVKVPAESELDEAKTALEVCKEKAEKSYKNATELNSRLCSEKNALLTAAQTLLGTECTFDKAHTLIKDRIAALDNEIRALEGKEKELAAKINEGERLKADTELKKAELKKKRESLALANQNLSDASSELSALGGQIKTAESELDSELEKAFGDSDKASADSRIRERSTQLDSELKALTQEQAEQQNRTRRHTELGNEIPRKEKECAGLDSRLTALEGQIASALTLSEQLAKQADELAKGLRFDSLEKAQAQITLAKKTAQELRSSVKALEESVNKCSNETSEISGRIDSLNKSIAQFADIDPDKAKEGFDAVSRQTGQARADKNAADTRVSKNRDALDRLVSCSDELGKAEHYQTTVEELAQTALGAIKGRKISLTSFALSSYFENVLARANDRMIIMSDGRYNLIHSGDSLGNSKIGLDIDIIDKDEETSRSVRSLSGGEGFMASLSLALGLAEEIQACVGGIEIDSLFVDEGFGTLDMSSLGLVMKALGCGSETGSGRSVGIISHVADIEGQVNHKISVKNHRTKGSTVSIE